METVYAISAKRGIERTTCLYVKSNTEDYAIKEAKRMIESGDYKLGNPNDELTILSVRILEDGIAKRIFLGTLSASDKAYIKEKEDEYVADAMSEHYADTGHPYDN